MRSLFVVVLGLILLASISLQTGADPTPMVFPEGTRGVSPSLNFTYLVADAVNFGSTAFRVWDDEVTIFIEAFPNQTYCYWDPETITDADLIIQNVHGHNSHYDPNECAMVAKNTGAICVGNSQFKSDMTSRGVSASRFVELSPSMGGSVNTTIPSLGIKITAYGMAHTYMSTTRVDTYLVEMANGVRWYHGTCSSGSNTMTYMGNYPELLGLDVIIADCDMNFGTLNTNFYAETMIKDHDFNSATNPKPATVYEEYPSVLKVMGHNQTYSYVRPDHLPELTSVGFAPSEGDPSTEFSFKVTYRYKNDKAPDIARIHIDNATFDMPFPSGTDWVTGEKFYYKTELDPGTPNYWFEFTVDGKTITYPESPAAGPFVNSVPVLDGGTVDPSSGDDDTTYTFSILYSDIDLHPALTRYVSIDDRMYSMSSEGGSVSSGIEYTFQKELDVGEHSYHFEFSDRLSTVRYPAEGELAGPTVVRSNYAPVLSKSYLSERTGSRDTAFEFSIVYRDSHGDPPSISLIHIDGSAYDLSVFGDEDYVSGTTFGMTTELGLGPHFYHFEFSDGQFAVRYPSDPTEELTGPTVMNRPPEITIISPLDETEYTTDGPVPFNATGTTDPDGDPLSYHWNSSVQGEIGTEVSFLAALVPGNHLITLTIDDGHGGVRSQSVSIIVVHYETILVGEVSITPKEPIEGGTIKVSATILNNGNRASGTVPAEILIDGSSLRSRQYPSIQPMASVSFDADTVQGHGSHRLELMAGGMVLADLEFIVAERAAPVARAGEDMNATVGEEVLLDGSGSMSAGSIEEYLWDLGDGTNATGWSVRHAYAAPGRYFVILRVRDELGKVSVDSMVVNVTEIVVPEEKGDDKGSSIAPVIGGAIVLLLLVVLAVVLSFLLLRRRDVQRGPMEGNMAVTGGGTGPAGGPPKT